MRNDFHEGAFLCHSAKGKGWANHKYVAKIKLSSGKYFYFYNLKDYQNYLKRQGKQQGSNALANPNKQVAETAAKGDANVEKLISTPIKGNTTEEKTKTLTNAIATGETKIQEALSKSSSTSSSSSSSSSKSSGSSSKSSGSSKKSSGSSKKSSGSSKSSKSSSDKSSKKSSDTTSKEKTTTTEKKKNTLPSNEPISLDSLKKTHGIEDKDVNTHRSIEDLTKKLGSYSDGAFGYIYAGNKAYKWSKVDGKIVFKDFDTEKEVTLDKALTDIQEFRTDKKKK